MALQLNQPASKELLDAYHLAMADETDPIEWQAFHLVAVKRFGWKFLPAVPELLDALREFRGGPKLDVEAARAYERVLDHGGVYTPEGGTTWNYRTVQERCGKAAADAFLAAGGHHAFANAFKESDRREKFIASYVSDVRAAPATMLPAGDAVKQIEGEPVAPLTAEDARQAIRKITGLVKVEAPEPKRLSDAERAERIRMLEEQAEELKKTLGQF